MSILIPHDGVATTFETLGRAVARSLNSVHVRKRAYKADDGTERFIYYTVGLENKLRRFAFVEYAILQPGDCLHTWVIGLNASTAVVQYVGIVELECRKSFPISNRSFLSQYEGIGPESLGNVHGKITLEGKAIDSSLHTTRVVERAINQAILARTKF